MSLNIQIAGLASLIQDGGRPSHRHQGVPRSGAADYLSLALANYCVGNMPDCAGVEMCVTGLTGTFTRDTVFAFCGGDIQASLDDKCLRSGKAYAAQKGDQLSFGRIGNGVRCYLAIQGGVKGRAFLGSVSSYNYASIGAFGGRALQSGDKLSYKTPHGISTELPIGYLPRYSRSIILRVMPAPEWNHLDAQSQNKLTRTRFTASAQTDRMGARLGGISLELINKTPMISGPILPGTVQVPENGAPILMLADSHCTGGYPRVLQVIRADRYLLGQIGPGTQVYFRLTSDEQAHLTLKRRTAFYQSLMPEFEF